MPSLVLDQLEENEMAYGSIQIELEIAKAKMSHEVRTSCMHVRVSSYPSCWASVCLRMDPRDFCL